MADPLSIISTAVDTIQKLREIAQKIKDADTLNLIADLKLALGELKIQFADLLEDNQKLKSEIKGIQENSILRSKLILKNSAYYLENPPEGYTKGGYCVRCFDAENKLITLTQHISWHGCTKCDNCKSIYRNY